MPEKKYCKVTGGLVLEVCQKFMKERNVIGVRIEALCERYGAIPKRYVSCGNIVEGLYFEKDPGNGWKRMAKFPGAYKPSKSKKKSPMREELAAINLLGPEDLAGRLNLPPFFYDGGHFCTAVGFTEKDGVFYLEVPKVISLNLPSVEWIDRGTYFMAVDK